jgi:lipopolysaccharide export system permease protein
MTLAIYFFEQFIPPFLFGAVLFLFVLLLDRLFDIVDLIFNKGVAVLTVAHLFTLFIPTVLPLTLPMACLLACLVTFGRMSEENELSAVRAAGVSLVRVLWIPPLFAFFLSAAMIPFNTHVAPWANRQFRTIYEKIASADPLLNIQSKNFFSIKNIKLYAEDVDKHTKRLRNLFLYQTAEDGHVSERVFARTGVIRPGTNAFTLFLGQGQLQRFDPIEPKRILHTSFETYRINLPITSEENGKSVRFRNYSSPDLKNMISDLKKQSMSTSVLEAEYNLRYAVAFAPLALALVGIPLATVLRRGGRSFSFGVSIVVIFTYYTLLIMGLTFAEKAILPAAMALWIGNIVCFLTAAILIRRLLKQ